MVGRFEVGYFEFDVFCPEILFCTKCDWESDRANWSRATSREDQWTSFSEPGRFPQVLDPFAQGSKLTRVLIDGGSGLNLIFASTLAKMDLNYMSLLTPSKAPFYGIVPRNFSTPIGSVTLPVTFGT